MRPPRINGSVQLLCYVLFFLFLIILFCIIYNSVGNILNTNSYANTFISVNQRQLIYPKGKHLTFP